MGKMRGSTAFKRHVFAIFCTALLAVIPTRVFAGTYAFFDFDETLIRCREEGLFKTPVKLFPVERRNSVLLPGPESFGEITVTCTDLDALRRYLAPGRTQVGSIEGVFTLEDGREIIPGYYYLDPATSFLPHYGEHPEGGNYLLDDLRAALARVKASPDPVKAMQQQLLGPAFPILQVMLSKPETAKSVAVGSARSHSYDREWPQFFDALIQEALIKHPPNYKLFMGATRPEFDRYNLDVGAISARKVGFWAEFAKKLRAVSLSEKDEKLGIDGSGRGRYHTLMIAEDNQRTLKKASVDLARIVQSKLLPLKVILINLGTDAEVADAAAGGMPRYSVINSTGLFREATPHEIFGEDAAMSIEDAAALMKLIPKQVSISCIGALKKPSKEKK